MDIVFFDCDGTLTPIKSSWEYLHRRLNLWDGLAEKFQTLYLEGKIDYHEFCKMDAMLWKGIHLDEVLRIVSEVPLTKGAFEMVKAFKEMGILTVIVSTGISFFVNRIKELLGIDYAEANELLFSNGRLTGEVKINVEQNRKDIVVKRILKKYGIAKEKAIAVGDGPGDISMFQSVGLPIGFNPDKTLMAHTKYQVFGEDLSDVIPLIKKFRR